ncbi:MAG: lactate utilization protein C [Gaiellaceae bacterium]
MSEAREEILRRIAAAKVGVSEVGIPRSYRTTGRLGSERRVALFCERVGEYRAVVRRTHPEELGQAIVDVGADRLAVPRGVPAAWRPAALELVEDEGLTPHQLDALDGVLTGCTVGIAETGSIVLTGGAREGRRALTLVPDLHICVVDEAQIVELVPEAFSALATVARRPITFISGPSATSDIELDRVEGVHGPRRLVVLVAGAGAS